MASARSWCPRQDAQTWFVALQPLADGLFFPEQEGVLIHLIDVRASAEDDKAVVRRQVGNLLMPYLDNVKFHLIPGCGLEKEFPGAFPPYMLENG